MFWPPLCQERPHGRIESFYCLRRFACSSLSHGELFLFLTSACRAPPWCKEAQHTRSWRRPSVRGWSCCCCFSEAKTVFLNRPVWHYNAQRTSGYVAVKLLCIFSVSCQQRGCNNVTAAPHPSYQTCEEYLGAVACRQVRWEHLQLSIKPFQSGPLFLRKGRNHTGDFLPPYVQPITVLVSQRAPPHALTGSLLLVHEMSVTREEFRRHVASWRGKLGSVCLSARVSLNPLKVKSK